MGEREPLTLHRDAQRIHNVVEMPNRELQSTAKRYYDLKNNPELLPRQSKEVERMLGHFVFEIYSRQQERRKEQTLIEGLANEFQSDNR